MASHAHKLPDVPPMHEHAEILVHEEVAPDHFLLRLHAPGVAAVAEPGMFLQLRVAEGYDPFLRRPMSISNATPADGGLEVVYRALGKGTRRLTVRTVGERVSVLGPLGNPFSLPEDGTTPLVLAGGGVGMPPMHFVAHRHAADLVTVVQGARTADLLLFSDEFADLGVRSIVATEDGSAGIRGLVTDALSERLRESGPRPVILSCGPTAMMREVARIARSHDIPCQVSLEERMACGFGICMGCAVKRTHRTASDEHYGLVCVDGPVFDANEVFGDIDGR